ncbi:hypothetical protein CBQ26_09255 [Deinococcus indicus]|uniref:Transcriptional regulator n=1 Tax=Deinococcus indicus TaxID=223556 RepID=A0A2D0A818_9DEIO|nr:hypothetical protein [Deinococcus indicus]OWL96554.1 hypothetical protein CBQ26_09255 [Deinococcus indicus]
MAHYRYQGGETPAERGAALLTSPIATYALAHVLTHGTVTATDLQREYPNAVPGRLAVLLRDLAKSGQLVAHQQHPRPATPHYTPGDLSVLRALHNELSALLALSPALEVRDETDR